MTRKKLFTFGYEGLAIDDFMSRLHSAGVNTVVDVRELPLSRKKGFSKNALKDRLAESEIGYLHVPPLGCPKSIRDQYRVDQDWQRYSISFNAYLQTQQLTINELAKFANSTTACLLCFEADFAMCHRTYVARAAYHAGAPLVEHLTAKTVFPDRFLLQAA